MSEDGGVEAGEGRGGWWGRSRGWRGVMLPGGGWGGLGFKMKSFPVVLSKETCAVREQRLVLFVVKVFAIVVEEESETGSFRFKVPFVVSAAAGLVGVERGSVGDEGGLKAAMKLRAEAWGGRGTDRFRCSDVDKVEDGGPNEVDVQGW